MTEPLPHTRSQLEEFLTQSVAQLHHDPTRLHEDPCLFTELLALYDRPPRVIWEEHIDPFITENQLGLTRAYDDHAVLDGGEEFDLPELLLILERLENDRLRLSRRWPRDPAALERLGDVWGVSL